MNKTDRVILSFEEACAIESIVRSSYAVVWNINRHMHFNSFLKKLDKATKVHEKLIKESKEDAVQTE